MSTCTNAYHIVSRQIVYKNRTIQLPFDFSPLDYTYKPGKTYQRKIKKYLFTDPKKFINYLKKSNISPFHNLFGDIQYSTFNHVKNEIFLRENKKLKNMCRSQ